MTDEVFSAALRILIVEDDAELGTELAAYLVERGYDAAHACDVPRARKLLAALEVDLCLLDIRMPGPSGRVLCREIVERSGTGVIMMSSLSDSDTIIALLELGADDYIVKPFEFGEMHARMRALQRRRGGRPGPRAALQRIGPWALELRDRRLRHDAGYTVALTPSETELLRFLAASPGTVFSREDLLAVARTRQHGGADDRAVDNLMRRLRRKIEEDPGNPAHLLTQWGKGYRLEA